MYTIFDIRSLGAELRAARKRAALTQRQLAAACGLSRQTIAQLEAGTCSDLGMRKVERVLARVGLRLRIEAAAAASGRSASGTRLERLLRARAEARRREATALARAALRALRKAGVSARIVGSLAKGSFRAGSDVDYLIEDRNGLAEGEIVRLVEAAMHGFPFDVVFAERVDPEILRLMREEARRGASALRAA